MSAKAPSINPIQATPNIYEGNDACSFMDKLPGYDSNFMVTELLEQARQLTLSNNYYWVGLSFPQAPYDVVAAGQTVSGTVSIPPGTYITAINAYGNSGGYIIPNVYAFKFSLYDKGTKAPIVYGDYTISSTITSDMAIQVSTLGDGVYTPDQPFGPAYLLSPFIVTPPGVIAWNIVSYLQSQLNVQMLLCCAVPINQQSLNTRKIVKE